MTITTILHYVKSKAVLALFPTGFFVLTEMHKEVIAIILWLLIIDTILGAIVAIKKKKFCSYKLTKAIYKFLSYALALATAYFVSLLNLPFLDYFYLYVGSFIAITEAISNFENLALIGFQLPQKMMSKLNSNFRDNKIEDILEKR